MWFQSNAPLSMTCPGSRVSSDIQSHICEDDINNLKKDLTGGGGGLMMLSTKRCSLPDMVATSCSPSKRHATNGNIPHSSPRSDPNMAADVHTVKPKKRLSEPLQANDLRLKINMRKRKMKSLDEESSEPLVKKKRRVGSKDRKSVQENVPIRNHTQKSVNGIIGTPKQLFGVTESPKNKYMELKQLNSNYSENMIPNCRGENYCDSEDGEVTFKVNDKIAHKESKMDKHRSELLDQNLNKISCIIQPEDIPVHIQQLYDSKLKNTSPESSPFKGKLSAFAISVMKGRENLERRKSLESASATIRSSPRANRTNNQRPNYCERKKHKRLSLNVESENPSSRSVSGRKDGNKSGKRKRTLTLESLSPKKEASDVPLNKSNKSKLRNVDQVKFRKHIGHEKKKNKVKKYKLSLDSIDKGSLIEDLQHRMNGAQKRKSLPSVISSGTKLLAQGQSSPSRSSRAAQHYRVDQVSGTPPLLHSHSSNKRSPSPSNSTQPLSPSRPSSLPISKSSPGTPTRGISRKKHAREHTDCTDTIGGEIRVPSLEGVNIVSPSCKKFAGAGKNALRLNGKIQKKEKKRDSHDPDARSSGSDPSRKCRKMSLEETVQMLRKSSGQRLQEYFRNRATISPGCSDSRASQSQLSLCSSTPVMIPTKTDLPITPSSESSTPEKLKADPGLSHPVKYRAGSCKGYLFAKDNEVLARWHDGRFYLGTILKIDENHQKCLLRYEDRSEYWSLFKDIHRVLKDEEMICCVCLGEHSEKPNEIVFCEYCLQGYHQQCHSPMIDGSKTMDPDDPWFCRQCVFLRTVQPGGAMKTGKWAEELRRVKLELPYDLQALSWDSQHKNNLEESYCYCGSPGIWYQKMLQCCRCKQWFHEACMQCLDYPLLFSDTFYIFVCSPCNYGSEYIKRLDVEWLDIIHICLFNLSVVHRRKYHDLETEIMPWLDENWEALQITQYDEMPDLEKLKILQKTLKENKNRFTSGSEIRKRVNIWGLRVKVPPPRIHVTLPSNEKVTDQMMKKHKIKGRRSKIFYVENKSPVNKLTQSPAHRDLKKKFDFDQEHERDPHSVVVKQEVSKLPLETPLFLLDRLIPLTDCYTSDANPFILEVEGIELKKRESAKSKIWCKYQSPIQGRAGSDDGLDPEDGPPVLEKMEPVVPSACNGTPPMPEIKDKPSTVALPLQPKALLDVQGTSEEEKRKTRARKSRSRQSITPDLTDSEKAAAEESDITVKQLREYKNYFCSFSKKTGYENGFFVCGKRYNKDGLVDYLVTWDH
ncbi:uncharacterized protein LOC127882361 isoform X3 [Dreissena polymorpha]|uniref:uncharacterized protein LOC127882361 isoform X3 n=1 Tax=Dreissena polymorpha TaxID=45954 RepID=UPI0022653E9E|nr:uncharacterized protein LOC127882361 isoform X3 [Dreissena polymorpha]